MANQGTVPAPADHGGDNAVQNANPGDLSSISPMFAKLQAMAHGDDSTNEEDNVPAPGNDQDHDDDVPNPDGDDGIVNDSDENDSNEQENDEGDDGESSLPTDDDIDWAYKVPVKVDGKEVHLTLEELRKGYATAQSLSAKGRELGDERKKLDQERNEKLQEVVTLGSTLHEQLEQEEKGWASQYHKFKAEMDKAVEDGDGYEAKELKKKVEAAQKKYWEAKQRKDGVAEAVGKQIAEAQERQHEEQMKYFSENIEKHIPNFDEKTADAIREFGVAEGIPEEVLGQIYEPIFIKLLNDYRILKEKATKGAEKRKEVPTRTTPNKKGVPLKQKQDKQRADLRGKVLLGEGDTRDQLDFLKNISSISSKLR